MPEVLYELQKKPPVEKRISANPGDVRDTTVSLSNPLMRTVLAFEDSRVQGQNPAVDGFVRYALTLFNLYRAKLCQNEEGKFAGFDNLRPEFAFQIKLRPYCGNEPSFWNEAIVTKAPKNIGEYLHTHNDLARFGLDILLRNRTKMLDLDHAIQTSAHRARKKTIQVVQETAAGGTSVEHMVSNAFLRNIGADYLENTFRAPNRPVCIEVVDEKKLDALLELIRHPEKTIDDVAFSTMTVEKMPYRLDALRVIHHELPDAAHFIVPYSDDFERKTETQEALAFLMLENIARRHALGPALPEIEERGIANYNIEASVHEGLLDAKERMYKERHQDDGLVISSSQRMGEGQQQTIVYNHNLKGEPTRIESPPTMIEEPLFDDEAPLVEDVPDDYSDGETPAKGSRPSGQRKKFE